MAILAPTCMLPLMSTRMARLSGDRESDRMDSTGRSSPLSLTSKSAGVNPCTIRPRPSRTDVWMVTTSTELRNVVCPASGGACACSEPTPTPTAAAMIARRCSLVYMIRVDTLNRSRREPAERFTGRPVYSGCWGTSIVARCGPQKVHLCTRFLVQTLKPCLRYVSVGQAGINSLFAQALERTIRELLERLGLH